MNKEEIEVSKFLKTKNIFSHLINNMKHLIFATLFCLAALETKAQMVNPSQNDFIVTAKILAKKYHLKPSLIIANCVIFSEASNGIFDQTNIFHLRCDCGKCDGFKRFKTVYEAVDTALAIHKSTGKLLFTDSCTSVKQIIKKYNLKSLDNGK